MSAEPLRMMEGGAGFGPDAPTPGAVAGGARHIRIPYNVFACTYLSHGAIVLYGWLQQHCGERGCFPSYDTLAKKMGCSTRAVSTYRQELEDAGVLRHERGGGARANDYTLTPDGLRDKSAKSANLSPVPDPPKSAKSASASLQNLPLTHAKSAYQSDPSIRPMQSEVVADAREAATPKPGRPERQPAMFPCEATPSVSAVLATLNLEPTQARIKAYSAVIEQYPDANHEAAAAVYAEWCERMQKPPTPTTFAKFCADQPAKGEHANGAHRQGVDAPGARFVPRARPSASPIRPSAATLERARAKDRGD